MRSLALVWAFLMGAAALAAPAGAVVIQQVEPDASLAEASWSIVDAGSHIAVDLVKAFKHPDMMGYPLVLEFTLEAADAGKDIHLIHQPIGAGDVGEEVTNLTGQPWVDYHFVLVNMDPGFPLPLPPFAAAEFVSTAGIVSDVFGTPDLADVDQIDFTGGPVANGGVVHFSNIRITHNGVDGGVFYLKQVPTPEPAALALLVGGALLLLIRRK